MPLRAEGPGKKVTDRSTFGEGRGNFRKCRISCPLSLRNMMKIGSLNESGVIRSGALQPRVKRKALTESTPPPDRKVGVAAAHVQAAPRGG